MKYIIMDYTDGDWVIVSPMNLRTKKKPFRKRRGNGST